MSYKFVRITNIYEEQLHQYYLKFPDVVSLNYKEQYEHFVGESIDTAVSMVLNLKRLGVDASIIVTNASTLQRQWKSENNCLKEGKDIIYEQIKSLQPEIIWVDDSKFFDGNWIKNVRKGIPSVRKITGHVCAPYNSQNLSNLSALDFLFTCTPCYKSEFDLAGLKTHLIYHSFDERMLDKFHVKNQQKQFDVIFSGSLITGGGFHNKRINYLEQIIKRNIDIRLFGNIESNSKILFKKLTYLGLNILRIVFGDSLLDRITFLKKYRAFGNTPVKLYSRKLKASVAPPVFGIDQLKLLSKSRIVFNNHLDDAKACAGNIRLFEVTGSGSCLLTDWKQNINELFVPGEEIVTYKSEDDCIDKIKWLLDNPIICERIAKAGQARTLISHTSKKRAEVIHDIILNSIL